MRLYTIYDEVADKLAPPFVAPNDAVAVRQFRSMAIPAGVPRADMHLVFIGDLVEDVKVYTIVERGQDLKNE